MASKGNTQKMRSGMDQTIQLSTSERHSHNDENQRLVPMSGIKMHTSAGSSQRQKEDHKLKRISKRNLPRFQSAGQNDGEYAPLKEHQTFLDLSVETKDVAEVLRQMRLNHVLISNENLENILNNYKKNTLIDELYDGYQITEDQHVPLCNALERCNMLWPDRQIFYDTVLKNYIEKRELQCHNHSGLLTQISGHFLGE
eukprot:793186_1